MNDLTQNTLPLATTAAFTQWSRLPASTSGEWARVFAQAHHAAPLMQGQRQIPSAAPVVRAHLAGELPRSGATHVSLQGSRGALAMPFEVEAYRTAVSGAAHDDATVVHAESNCRPTTSSDEEAPPSERTPPGASRTECQADATRVRVHVEHHADGLAVWLGTPGGLAAPEAADLLSTLRRAAPAGFHLARLTCNGRSVYDRLDPSKEIP